MVWLAGTASSYEEAETIFKRIARRHIPRSSIRRQANRAGACMKAYQEHQQDLIGVERVRLLAPWEDHYQRKGVSMDGGMVHIREEGWKEIKVGAAFDIVMQPQRDPVTGEWAEHACADQLSYTAVLGGVGEFAKALWKLALDADIPSADQSSVTADGAPWIWNVASDLFPDSTQIVDWYHATQHLSAAGHALYPDNESQAHKWVSQKRQHLFQGDIHLITTSLDGAGLSDHSRYFHTHKRRMQYHQFQDDGFPIGSGTVESSIKQFKARLTGPGMRWSRSGAEHMLVIRAAVMDDSFDDLWASAA
jgi:hypothetical protein